MPQYIDISFILGLDESKIDYLVLVELLKMTDIMNKLSLRQYISLATYLYLKHQQLEFQGLESQGSINSS